MKIISPRVGLIFKKIFGIEENKDLLISFINSILGRDNKVLDIALINPYIHQKLSIIKIKAKGINDTKIDIQIQINSRVEGILYEWAKLYTEQLKSDHNYLSLNRTIIIHILNSNSILESRHYHNSFHITEKVSEFAYFKDLELHTIELNKFDNSQETLQCLTTSKVEQETLHMWLTFLTRYELLKVNNLPRGLNNDKLKKALKVLSELNLNKEEKAAYENDLESLQVENYKSKKTTYVNSKKRSLIEVISIGRIKATERTAVNMLKQKLNDKLISSVTGLNLEEILKLKNKY